MQSKRENSVLKVGVCGLHAAKPPASVESPPEAKAGVSDPAGARAGLRKESVPQTKQGEAGLGGEAWGRDRGRGGLGPGERPGGEPGAGGERPGG